MVGCSDDSEEDKSARAGWSRKASWRRRTFTWTWEDGEDSAWQGESAIGHTDGAPHEQRQERIRWNLKEILWRWSYRGMMDSEVEKIG